jgi:hypothetical protein
MTRQEIFEKVARHLLTQNAKAVRGIACCYRTADGKACAVGCLLTNEQAARADQEFLCVAQLARAKMVPADMVSLLEALQYVHDAREPAEWPDRLRDTAKRFNLDASAVAS